MWLLVPVVFYPFRVIGVQYFLKKELTFVRVFNNKI